jgi:hypothetical protein
MVSRRHLLAASAGFMSSGVTLGIGGLLWSEGRDHSRVSAQMVQSIRAYQASSGAIIPSGETEENPYVTAAFARAVVALGQDPSTIKTSMEGYSLKDYYAMRAPIDSGGNRGLTDSIARLDAHVLMRLPTSARLRQVRMLVQNRLEKEERQGLPVTPNRDTDSLGWRVYAYRSLIGAGEDPRDPLLLKLKGTSGVEGLRDPVSGGLREFLSGGEGFTEPLVDLSVPFYQATRDRRDFDFIKTCANGQVMLRGQGEVNPIDSKIEIVKVLGRKEFKDQIAGWWESVRFQASHDASTLLRLANAAQALA